MKKIKYENIELKHYPYLKINISFMSLYILSMSRKEDTILICSKFPVRKGVNHVLLPLLPNHRELFMAFFLSSAGSCASLNFGNDLFS